MPKGIKPMGGGRPQLLAVAAMAGCISTPASAHTVWSVTRTELAANPFIYIIYPYQLMTS